MFDIEKCKITRYPNDVLAKPAQPVEQIDDNIRQLVEKMKEIMFASKGIGLAAPQIGVSLRLFVISLDGNMDSVRVYINPTVTPIGELDAIEEGCLSVPGVYAKIKRYKKCTVTATDINDNEFTDQAEGLYARCLQHENDHIEGITIVNRLGQAAKIMNRRLLKKLEKNFDSAH